MKTLALLLALTAGMTQAATWQLKDAELKFTSVKNETVSETHTFKTLTGSWDEQTANISILVKSLDTLIPIRDERIWQYVLLAEQYSSIKVSVPLTKVQLSALKKPNDTMVLELPVSLTIMEQSAVITTAVHFTQLSDNTIEARTHTPILLDTKQFGLTAGIAKLQEMAGLKSIDTTVPVTFNVTFSKN